MLGILLSVLTLAPGAPPAVAGSVYEDDVRFAVAELEKQCGELIREKKIDWKKVSDAFTKEAKSVKTDSKHLLLLARLVARLRDGHAAVLSRDKTKDVRFPDAVETTGPGVFLCRSGKKVLVKNAWNAGKDVGLAPGMEIVEVDDLPASKWLDARVEKLRDRIGFSSDHQALFYACHWGLADKPGARLELELKDLDDKPKKRTLTYAKANPTPWGPAFFPKDLESTDDLHFGFTEKGFGYVHVRRSPDDLPAQIDKALKKVCEAKGLVLDFRGNSGGGFDHDAFMGRFVPKDRTISFGNTYRSAGAKPYGGRIVAIVDATVRSAGETAAGIFKEDGRAYMIGESPTAGMSAQKTTIELPSKLFALYVATGSNKQRFNGGKGIEGIGVVPHRIVEFDPKDLAKEVDTLIRVAEELLEKFPQKDVPYDPKDFGQ